MPAAEFTRMTPTRRTRAHRARCGLAALAVSVMAALTLAPAAAGEQPHEAQGVTVPIRDLTFTSPDLRINTGDTVTWVNEDRAPHDVTSTSAPAPFASGTLKQNQSFSHTFTAPGAYSYQCTIHPDMVATVTAIDHSPAAAAAPPAEAVPDEGVPAEDVPAEDAPVEGAPEESAGAPVPATDAPATDASAPAGAVPASGALPVPADAQRSPGTTQAVGVAQGRQFDPLLIVAGVALGVATLCLLLVTSGSTRRS